MRQIIYLIALAVFLFFSQSTSAIYNPLSTPNNKVGVHILFPNEVKEAARLVNSNGGNWGYVIIPVQASDRNLEKWQKFMDDCKNYNLIPIIRISTNGDYFNTKVWEKPTFSTVLDFANFLNSLDWPIKNKYVVIFNEVNRGDEWGGSPEPDEYAQILSYAVTVFKSKSPDFFIISAGMDNASVNNYPDAMDKFTYFLRMEQKVPGIFNQIDGLSSHSYPNPAFSQPPSLVSKMSISSFLFEKRYISNFTNKDLPVFITETGWTRNKLTDNLIGTYYKTAFNNTWDSKDIVAVTPFILTAGSGPFKQFSMKNEDGSDNKIFESIASIKKIKGKPIMSNIKKVLGEGNKDYRLPIISFEKDKKVSNGFDGVKNTVVFLKWLLRID